MNDKQVATRKPKELREWLESESFKNELSKSLPQTMSAARFVRIALTSTLRNPKLLQCSRETFFRCLLDLSAIGLEPDSRNAHLIPRRNKAGGYDCTLIVDYKGLKETLYRSGDIIDEHSDVVGDLDFFEYEFGSNKHLTHKPATRGRGRIYAAYSFVTLPRGGTSFDVMSIDEIEAIRKRSASGDAGPWVTDWAEMAKKSVFKRLAKSLPLSPRTRDAIELDNTHEVQIEPVSAKVAGGSHKNLGDGFEASGETPESPESEPEPPDEPPAPAPQEPEPAPPARPTGRAPRSPQERVSHAGSSKAASETREQLREALKESGFSEAEFLAVLVANRLVEPETTFDKIGQRTIDIALENWPDAIQSMKDSRRAAHGVAHPEGEQEEFPV